jgi:hypothetical protein
MQGAGTTDVVSWGFFDCENLVGSMLESQLEGLGARSMIDRRPGEWLWRPMLSHMTGGKGVA